MLGYHLILLPPNLLFKPPSGISVTISHHQVYFEDLWELFFPYLPPPHLPLKSLCHRLNVTPAVLDFLSWGVDSSWMQALYTPNPRLSGLHTPKLLSDIYSRKCSYFNTIGPSPQCLPSLLTVLPLPSVDDYYLLFISHDTILCCLQDIKGYTTPALSLQPRLQSCAADIT